MRAPVHSAYSCGPADPVPPPPWALPVTPSPDVTSLLCALQTQGPDTPRGFRPGGTREWVLIGTLGGQGYCRWNGASRRLTFGDLLLMAPGTPQDYGYIDERSDWTNVWVHFRPRPHWLPWLTWPEAAPGIMLLAAGDEFPPIEEELRRMVDATNHPSRFRVDRALNCLERILIQCNDLNPSFEMAGVDVRARRAMEMIGERLTDPPSVAELAGAVGLSRSRFTAVFSDATGLSPRAYAEEVRLARAAQMLVLSTAPVGQIAEQVGFLNAFHFSARFRAHYGLPPSVYRTRVNQQAQQPDPSSPSRDEGRRSRKRFP